MAAHRKKKATAQKKADGQSLANCVALLGNVATAEAQEAYRRRVLMDRIIGVMAPQPWDDRGYRDRWEGMRGVLVETLRECSVADLEEMVRT